MTQDSGLRTNYARDKDYWNDYYSGTDYARLRPSSFAESIVCELDTGRSILDIGCGNGRDSLYFLTNGLKVTGIDASDIAIEKLRGITSGNESAEFLCGDFVNDARVYAKNYDYVYSRFTLHAISTLQQNELLRNIKQVLKPEGKLFIEARTIRDNLYGIGEGIGDNAFIHDGHYRRFIEPEELAGIMSGIGYKIISLKEGKGFSKTKSSDPVLMRLTASV